MDGWLHLFYVKFIISNLNSSHGGSTCAPSRAWHILINQPWSQDEKYKTDEHKSFSCRPWSFFFPPPLFAHSSLLTGLIVTNRLFKSLIKLVDLIATMLSGNLFFLSDAWLFYLKQTTSENQIQSYCIDYVGSSICIQFWSGALTRGWFLMPR